MRLETYLSTQPPAPGKNARLSNSDENSGGAQCVTAPPSEEPSSLDSLKSSFDLSSIPQDFSAAAPKRVPASVRRRAAPQRVTMHALLPAQRATIFTSGNHHANATGERCPAQSLAAAGAGSIPTKSSKHPGWLGHRGQSSRGCGEGNLHHAPTGTAAVISATGPLTAGELVKFLVLGAIRFYQACLSPVLPSTCRFYPSCSAYAFEAIEKWGILGGGRLALGRILRCRPWGKYGYDAVPERAIRAE